MGITRAEATAEVRQSNHGQKPAIMKLIADLPEKGQAVPNLLEYAEAGEAVGILEEELKSRQGTHFDVWQESIAQTFTVKLWMPTGTGEKASKEECQLTFNGHPTFDAFVGRVESQSRALNLEDHSYSLKRGKEFITQENWSILVQGKIRLTAAVVLHKPKALSSFTNEEGLKLLLGDTAAATAKVDNSAFPAEEIDGNTKLDEAVASVLKVDKVQSLLEHLAFDLSLRCLRMEPKLQTKEYAKRELISPLLYIAAVLAGELEVASELNAKDRDAHGSVDFAVLYQKFIIAVMEGKLHDTLTEHVGQLCASMHTCREQYMRQNLRKRKRDADPMTAVPSAGILSNGTSYIFYKCDHRNLPELVCSDLMVVNLHKDIAPEEAAKACKTVLGTMVSMFRAQKEAISKFEATRG